MQPTVDVNSKLKVDKVKSINIDVPVALEAYVEFIVKDPKGKVVSYHRQKAESFVRQFIDILYVKMGLIRNVAGSYWPTTDYANSSQNLYNASPMFDCTGAATEVTEGVIIGTGDTAVTVSDYALETPIAHATMNYGATTFGAPADDGTTSLFRITRVFSNVSGGSVTVKEVGLYFKSISWYFMAARDLVSGGTGVAVADGNSLTVNYQIQGNTTNYITRGFIQLLYTLIAQATCSITDTGNTARTIYAGGTNHGHLAVATCGGRCQMPTEITADAYSATLDGEDFGVWVGSDDTAIDSADYALGAKIAHGTTSGADLLYAGTEIDVPVVSAPTASLKVRRYFYNGSGASVAVEEAGLVAIGVYSGGAAPILILHALTGTVTVADTELLKVEFTISITTA